MKKMLKVLLAFALSIVMILSLAACEMDEFIEYTPNEDVEEETLSASEETEKTVNAFFEALSNKDRATAESCLKQKSMNISGDDENTKSDPATDALKTNFYNSFSYEIVDIQIVESQTVKVITRIDALDMTEILPEYLKYAIELSNSADAEGSMSEEGINEALKSYMTSLLNAQEAPRREAQIDIKVIKSNDEWLIDSNETFFDAITGGMITVGRELNKSDY